MIYLKLLWAFFKIGAFSFGGGYAMLPFIEREIVNNNNWITNNQFVDIIGISQMTPGPVAINSATFVGYKVSGVLGSISATTGVVLMSFILVSILQKTMEKFKESKVVKNGLMGMRPILIALIINAFLSLAKTSYVDWQSIIITLITGAVLLSKKIHPILTIVLAAILGIIFYK
ncbi:chromate transporter [Clostridium fallax]|uniref:Chromate transporter n=1 Tax=Clostridium fallax TaxID=1533 RepID=A0A1M4TU18_9CLOT|nr:chromate transporter [Clostridium fallax]SHE47942.1 chromate transporter [Clostridium fallax]SQB22395.1 chromate transport protein [Clostridium fallax]